MPSSSLTLIQGIHSYYGIFWRTWKFSGLFEDSLCSRGQQDFFNSSCFENPFGFIFEYSVRKALPLPSTCQTPSYLVSQTFKVRMLQGSVLTTPLLSSSSSWLQITFTYGKEESETYIMSLNLSSEF